MKFRAAVAAISVAGLLSSTQALGQTTNYGWGIPTVGASANQWGSILNTDLSAIDSTVFGVQTTANGAMPRAGGTFTGSVTFNAAVTFGLTTVHTGAATYNGTATFNGAATFNGGLSGALTGNVTGNVSGNATTATTATNATQLGGVVASGYVQNNGGTWNIGISGTANNANNLGNVAASSFVQNNGGTWGINISGNAATASNASALNGDHILRGNVSAWPNGDTWVNYSTAFTSGVVPVITGIGSSAVYINSPALNGFNVHNPTGSTISVNWVAVGN